MHLSVLSGSLSSGSVMACDSVFVRTDKISAASSQCTAEQSAKQPMMFSSHNRARGGSDGPTNNSALLPGSAWEVLATAGTQHGCSQRHPGTRLKPIDLHNSPFLGFSFGRASAVAMPT
jgi:hypothetical protein